MQRRRILYHTLQALSIVLLGLSSYLLIFGAVPGDDLVPPEVPPPVLARTVNAPPDRVRIPRIGVDAPVTPVGLTAAGTMDVPAHADTVGWYTLAAVPGEDGSAVLSGHLDTVLGTAAVFYDLKTLVSGDEIFIRTRSGAQLRFVVRETASYPYDASPLQRIFAGTGGTYLNLITCDGTWNRKTYDRRTVVYAEMAD